MSDSFTLKLDTCMKMSFLAKMTYPEECCGVLVGSGNELSVDKVFFLENRTDDGRKDSGYLIDPGAVVDVERDIAGYNEDIVGVFHSHPDAEAVLSREDEQNMIPGMVYVILSIIDEKCRDIRAYIKNEPDGRASSLTLSYVR